MGGRKFSNNWFDSAESTKLRRDRGELLRCSFHSGVTCCPCTCLLRKYLFISVCSQVFVEVDLHIEANNDKHRTSEISLEQLVLRRGHPFDLTIELEQPFDPKRDPLILRAHTGWCLMNQVSFATVFFFSSSFLENAGKSSKPTVLNNRTSFVKWQTVVKRATQ